MDPLLIGGVLLIGYIFSKFSGCENGHHDWRHINRYYDGEDWCDHRRCSRCGKEDH